MQPHEEDSPCKSNNYLWKLSSVVLAPAPEQEQGVAAGV